MHLARRGQKPDLGLRGTENRRGKENRERRAVHKPVNYGSVEA